MFHIPDRLEDRGFQGTALCSDWSEEQLHQLCCRLDQRTLSAGRSSANSVLRRIIKNRQLVGCCTCMNYIVRTIQTYGLLCNNHRPACRLDASGNQVISTIVQQTHFVTVQSRRIRCQGLAGCQNRWDRNFLDTNTEIITLRQLLIATVGLCL
jgi:hypothetical protein